MDAHPGAELVLRGLSDLRAGRETVDALVVSIGAPRLRRAGIDVESPIAEPERRLHELLGQRYGNAAHSKYNALIRRLVSFERSIECA